MELIVMEMVLATTLAIFLVVMIKIDIPGNTLEVELSDKEIGERLSRLPEFEPRIKSGYLRRYAERYPVPDRQAEFEHVLNIAPNARLEELGFTDPYDYSRDTRVDMKVSAEGFAAGANEVRMFRMPRTLPSSSPRISTGAVSQWNSMSSSSA